MKYNWKVLKRTKVYDGSPHLRVYIDKVKLPNGEIIDNYHRIEGNDAVLLLVENAKNELLVYNEYRHGIGKRSYTLPAGGIKKDENSLEASDRELLEETGYVSKQKQLLGKYQVSGSYKLANISVVYHWEIIKQYKATEIDIENPELIWLNRDKVLKALKNNKFISMMHLSAVLMWIFKESLPYD